MNSFFLEDFEDEDFQILAIRTILEDCKLAYLLNDALKSTFHKIVPDLEYIIKGKSFYFPAYKFEDQTSQCSWYLVNNKCKTTRLESYENGLEGLFTLQDTFTTAYVYLQPEIKEADFFLKIESVLTDFELNELLKSLNKIGGIVTAYKVDTDKLKHKKYLIF